MLLSSLKDLFRVNKAFDEIVTIKGIYIDIVGDLVAGILLSQIIYWFTPNKEGRSKLRVKKDGYYWVAKKRSDWWKEIRITARQYDRAIQKLEDKQIVIKELYKFKGTPMHHIRLNEEVLIAKINKELNPDFNKSVKSTLQKGKSGNYQKGKVDLTESVNSLTETTTKITTETTQKRRGKELIAFYEKCFGRLISTYQLEVLEGYLEDGLNEEMIILAMKESSLNNANNFAYLKAVLDDWLSKGLITKKKVKSYLEERKARYSNKSKGKNELPTNLQNALDLVEQCDVEDEDIWEVD